MEREYPVMKKKAVLRRMLLFLLAVLIFAGTAGGNARAETAAFTTEDCPMERDGQRIYGKLYLPGTKADPLPLVILSHGLGSNHLIMEPYAKRIIKLAGHRVSLDEIDSMMMDELNIPSVSVGTDDHLVVFVTGEREKEMVAAFVPRVLSATRGGLRVLTVPAFLKNEGGKILYSELQAAAEKN